ncbi:MAG: hypothetical protein DYH15_14575 [Nitrosomonas sp. PRO4]|nr:hypothetical protein [Nitrosomonas sp. PRO4]
MRAELALQAEPLIAAKAKERQESGINQHSLVANLPPAETRKTRDELSAMSGVSARNISKVKNILETGSDELIQKVDAGGIAEILSVSKRMVSNYLGDIDKQIREDRKETIRSMYLQCYTDDEITEIVGLQRRTMSEKISSLTAEMEVTSKTPRTANFQDDFDPL